MPVDVNKIDAVVLSGSPLTATAVGECKWARRIAAQPVRARLVERARALPRVAADARYIVCAREEVTSPAGVVVVTAADIFG